MNIYSDLNAWHEELTALRRDLHMHPEIAFEEFRTSQIIADALASYGVDHIARDWAKTGIVATIHGKNGAANDPDRAIALRADMDALPIIEETDLAYKSVHVGKMHACGHDGHVATLLLAAKYLATHRNFSGSVHLIFQPAEESGGGGEAMVKQGLFEAFPVKSVWGMHNSPNLPIGTIGMCAGPIMAAVDEFYLTIRGKGGHAAAPHRTIDPIAIGAQIVTALQNIVSRNVDPIKHAVCSITQFHAGFTHNVIVDDAKICGTLRSFDPDVRALLIRRVEEISKGIAESFGATIDLRIDHGYPATINTLAETEIAAQTAQSILPADKVNTALPPVMGGEDFSYMLEKRPGCYIRLGTAKTDNDPGLHNARFDFNDDALPIGAMYFVRLVETNLPL